MFHHQRQVLLDQIREMQHTLETVEYKCWFYETAQAAGTTEPAAIGPYSQGVQAGNTVYVSGQLYFVPETGELLEGTIGEMTEQCMKNIAAILAEADCTLADIVKTTIFLKDLNDFAAVNEAYGKFFPQNPPARACVQVAQLPRDAKVEIEAIAVNG